MYNQMQIEFSVHPHENNAVSEGYLEANRKRLSKNCKALFDKMMAGYRLTSFNCGLVDFRRRICDLKENGVLLSSEPHTFFHIELDKVVHCKIWYMTDEQKQHNQKLI